MSTGTQAERAWLEQWRSASAALETQHRAELRALSAQQALAASEVLLSLADARPLPDRRRAHSGLVEQQALFHRPQR
jgi:hypothetical protein